MNRQPNNVDHAYILKKPKDIWDVCPDPKYEQGADALYDEVSAEDAKVKRESAFPSVACRRTKGKNIP